MIFFSKCSSLQKFKIIPKNFPWKRFSAQAKNETEDSNIISNISNIIQKFLIPPLEQNKLKTINEVTGISLKMGYVGWVKISIETLNIMEWNFQTYSENLKNLDEPSLLKLAFTLKQILPTSDLYIMEKIRSREASRNLNDICLSSMLMVFLNNFTIGAQEYDKVVFQKENIVNKLHNLSIGSERVSARKVLEEMLRDINEFKKPCVSKSSCRISDYVKNIKLENLEFYDKSSLAQQECLSSTLLLTLSFIDVFIFKNVESLKILQQQSKFNKI